MNSRQFFVLFLCNLIPWWVGSALVSLLPLYAAELDASPTVVGSFLSFLFLALAAGTMAGGWIAPRMHNFRRLLMILGVCSAVAIFLMGHVTSIWQLILLSVIGWFSSGITSSLVMVLVGQHAATDKLGRTFGFLTMATALGGLLGGISGFIVDQWGYPWLFTWGGATWLVQIVVASFLVNPPRIDQQRATAQSHASQSGEGATSYVIPFLLLITGALFVSTAGFAGFLSRTLAMEANGFPSTTITLLAALGSGLGLVTHPLLGRLSDRGIRRLLLGVLYIVAAIVLVITMYAHTVSDFVIVAILLAFSGAERGISVALVGDFVPTHALGRCLALFDGVKWLGGVVGLAGVGFAIEQLGITGAMLLSTLLPLLATLLLLFLPAGKARRSQPPAVEPKSGWPVQQEGAPAQ